MPPLKKPRPKFLKHPGAQAKPDKPHHPGKPDLDKRKERKPEKKPQKLVESHPLEHRHGRAARRDVYILGVAMSRHDRAACLLKNGQVVGAIGEERLDRRRRSLGSYQSYPRGLVVPPLAAITYLLRLAGISWDRVDLCVCGRSMTLCREALLERVPFPADRVVEPPLPGHHLAHAYSAYGTAPFANCAVLVIDEQGHHIDGAFEKCTWYEGATGPLTLVDRFFGGGDDLSLGMLYNAFAAMTSLTEADSPAAGKLMGLAALGRPHPEWPQLVSLDSARGDTLVSLRRLDEFLAFAGLPRRAPIHEAPLRQLEDLPFYVPVRWDTQLAADLARKAQEELERAVLHIAEAFRRRSSADSLCYAGGVALNCTTNRRLLEAGWKDVYIHPAATDDGNAVGLALYGWIEVLGRGRQPVPVFNPFTGRRYSRRDVRDAVRVFRLDAFVVETPGSEEGAQRAARGEVVCWFEGESEWGPRALGGRSIIASPTRPGIKERINSAIKFREAFRPLAISGTREGLAQLVACDTVPASLAPYMLSAGQVIDERLEPIRHVDGTVRYQIVNPKLQPAWYELIQAFGRRTGIFAIVNTSFNTLGEPLVETPMDAVRQFLLSGADALIAQGLCLARADIPPAEMTRALRHAWKLTPIDPLAVARGLEDAGYADAAIRLLEDLDYTAETAMAAGLGAICRYHALQLRAAVRRGALERARHHADVILRWSGLPPEAMDAAIFMSEDPDDDRRRLAGRLIGGLAMPGGALRLFSDALRAKPSR